MAYQKPTDIDGFISQMAKADMRVKALLAEDLVAYLSDQENSIVSEDLGLLVDGLMPWLTGSHYKVSESKNQSFRRLRAAFHRVHSPIVRKWQSIFFFFVFHCVRELTSA